MNKPENIISIKVENGKLLISVPIDLLAHAAENHPTEPMIIQDKQYFAELVAGYIENEEDPDTGLTELQQLFDKAFYEVGCYGHEGIEFKPDDNA